MLRPIYPRTGEYTVSFWMTSTDDVVGTVPWGLGDLGGGTFSLQIARATTEWRMVLFEGIVNTLDPDDLSTGQSIHVAIQVERLPGNPTFVRASVNGQVQGNVGLNEGVDLTSMLPMVVGRDYTGGIDEVRVYQRLLSPDEIAVQVQNGNGFAMVNAATDVLSYLK